MPELPEVETMRRGVLPVVGRRVKTVSRLRCRLRPIEIRPTLATFRRRTVGHVIERVDRAGKRVVLCLDSGDRIVLEPRMTGLVLLADPPDWGHCRLKLELDDGHGELTPLFYWDRRGLGSVRLFSASGFEEEFGPHKLGPDALAITAAQLRQRLGPSRREVKVALLDQKTIAGVGNLYASEMLHAAGIHPQRTCDSLSPADWRDLRRAMRQILQAAIRYEGSTLSDGTYRNALNERGNYQNHHRVYGRAEKPCRCGRVRIVRVVQAQRSTFFCPMCQPE